MAIQWEQTDGNEKYNIIQGVLVQCGGYHFSDVTLGACS